MIRKERGKKDFLTSSEAATRLVTSLCDFLQNVSKIRGDLTDEASYIRPSLELLTKLMLSSQQHRWIVANQRGLVWLMKLLQRTGKKCSEMKIQIWLCVHALLGDDWEEIKSKESGFNGSEVIENGNISPSALVQKLNYIKKVSRQTNGMKMSNGYECYTASLDISAIVEELDYKDDRVVTQSSDSDEEIKEVNERESYLLNSLLDVTSDLTHELRPNQNVRNVSGSTLAKIASSMLNTGKGGCIYYGINENRIVRGIRMDREIKNIFRISVDTNFTNQIQPSLTHDMYSILYVPVVENERLLNAPVGVNHKLYVIEITLKPRSALFFLNNGTCYCRIGDVTQLASSQQIREKAAMIEDMICVAEIDRLKKEISLYK